MGFTRKMKPVDFFAKNVWLRAIVDLAGLTSSTDKGGNISVIDWKTGQYRPSEDQVTLYNVAALCQWPQAESSTSALVFVDHKRSAPPVTTHRSELPGIIEDYAERVEAIQIANEKNEWLPTQYWGCRWCGVTDCRYVGR